MRTRAQASRRLFVILVVVGALFGGGVALVNSLLGGGTADGPVTVEVTEGMGAGAVARLLEEKGVISNAFLFRTQARFDDRASRIRPGTYTFEPGASTDEILAALSAAPSEAPTFRVTIPEGLRIGAMLDRIAAAEGSPYSKKQLRQALAAVALPEWVPEDLPEGAQPFEGLLFPATYELLTQGEAPDVIAQLVEQTEKVLDDLDVPPQERYETLIKASLIEREARVREEQPVIASVIENRIAEGMRLQIDATVIYAKGEDVNRVLLSDLEIQSPWNTYVTDGLPPTPISGAGQSAIAAAANPDETDFLYYVVSDRETGEHVFAETLSEHNANVQRYRELRAQEQDG